MLSSPRRHAVVTGASSGIGAAVTGRLLDDGWRVTALCRSEPDSRAEWIRADLAGEFRSLLAAVSDVDAVVHAAGLQRSAPLSSLSAEDGARMWAVHVSAAEVLVSSLSERLVDGGRVVLIGSRTMVGVPGKSQYAATKAALSALARSWAAELAPRRVTVNVVAPGPTDTPMLLDPGRVSTPVRVPPLGRLVTPGEVAALVAFLLGSDGSSITGQTLVVCGGASL
ncbi:SDR family NAD(P)-dependent oxidoreductase [Amycolatopsis sp. YIM 10]|uniref:SDR family NAD(P)-dependent oxidoreductase n=1 Tax=Amycolatopsis sp. YIM 10 TaxID=2653857 RepID=UPI0012902586|nr:SDR family oxidoreductase [Amycolatopsis sp. YIM 10]QFU88609.1 3-oxoacyl-[acyl-carrier-protein] reductase FabG [Amycolatopsis sp. YIM 10]